MPSGVRLSDYERGLIDSKAALGWSQRAITSSINRSVTVVNNYLRDRDNYGKKNPGGRPEKLSDADKRQIIRCCNNSALSVMEFKRACNINACKTTVWKAMESYD